MGSFVGGLLGGGKSSSSSSSQSGWSLLPKEIQDAYTGFANKISAATPGAMTSYTPLAQTADESKAFDILRQGFSPTPESLNRDVSMLTNPFDDFVLGDVNRAAGSDYSILKQDLNSAGQFGSNRQRLGANDIEQTRLGTIGKLRQDQYNKSIDQIFSGLIPARAADATGLLSIGNFQRGLDTQTNTANITGLQELAKALGILPTNGGQTSSSQGENSTGLNNTGTGALFKALGSIFG